MHLMFLALLAGGVPLADVPSVGTSGSGMALGAAPALAAAPVLYATAGPDKPGIDGLAACATGCEPCGPYGKCWFGAEALLWWMNGAKIPPLVTTSPPGTPVDAAGVLPDATVLFGGSRTNEDWRIGGRLTAGTWLDCDHLLGIEGYFFILGKTCDGFDAGSSGDPILSRPFLDVSTGQQSAELVSFPGILAGRVRASATTGELLGAGALARCNLCCGCDYRIDALAGYRYLHFYDGLSVREDLLVTAPDILDIPPGTTFVIEDRFRSDNQFHGLEFGLAGEVRRGRFILSGRGKVAVGKNYQTLLIDGSTTTSSDPEVAPTTGVGGLLALRSNIGVYCRDEFTVVPELGLRLGWECWECARVFVGYSLMVWPRVLRAGEQVDLGVNPGLLPPPDSGITGPYRPTVPFQRSTLWLQGVDLGFELRF